MRLKWTRFEMVSDGEQMQGRAVHIGIGGAHSGGNNSGDRVNKTGSVQSEHTFSATKAAPPRLG